MEYPRARYALPIGTERITAKLTRSLHEYGVKYNKLTAAYFLQP